MQATTSSKTTVKTCKTTCITSQLTVASTLKIRAICPSETLSTTYRSACNNPREQHRCLQKCKNLSQIDRLWFWSWCLHQREKQAGNTGSRDLPYTPNRFLFSSQICRELMWSSCVLKLARMCWSDIELSALILTVCVRMCKNNAAKNTARNSTNLCQERSNSEVKYINFTI
jgi:hypothetical protein